ncbi:MAG: glycosyltransferase family 4 protein, partial [Deltaproteobacteria bacterium]|nr:glycosyltransferase family 4 protein [Deltaproteobacteria bacterium]
GGSFEDLHRPDALTRGDIIDLSHVSELDKKRLIKHALFLCQPSVNESFSIVIMEAWQLGVTVVVHADCAVTRHHVLQSGGGLYFGSQEDFCGVLRRLHHDADLRCKLGQAGRRYVGERYNWEAVLQRFDRVMQELLESPDPKSDPEPDPDPEPEFEPERSNAQGVKEI